MWVYDYCSCSFIHCFVADFLQMFLHEKHPCLGLTFPIGRHVWGLASYRDMVRVAHQKRSRLVLRQLQGFRQLFITLHFQFSFASARLCRVANTKRKDSHGNGGHVFGLVQLSLERVRQWTDTCGSLRYLAHRLNFERITKQTSFSANVRCQAHREVRPSRAGCQQLTVD